MPRRVFVACRGRDGGAAVEAANLASFRQLWGILASWRKLKLNCNSAAPLKRRPDHSLSFFFLLFLFLLLFLLLFFLLSLPHSHNQQLGAPRERLNELLLWAAGARLVAEERRSGTLPSWILLSQLRCSTNTGGSERFSGSPSRLSFY